MAEAAPPADLVIRPSTAHYKQTLKTTPPFVLVFLGAAVAYNGLGVLVLLFAVMATSLGLVAIYMKRARIVVTPTQLIRFGITGIPRSWPRSAVGGLLRAMLSASALDTRVFEYLFVLDGAGRTLVRLKSSHWSEADMARLVSALGLVPDGPPPGQVVSAKELAVRFPNALPVYERRPLVFTFLVIAAIVVIVVIVVVAVIATG